LSFSERKSKLLTVSHLILFFNIDEMGHQDWADRGQQTCVVPAADHDDYVYMPVSRAGKRITLMACIATDGSAIKPQIIIPRKTINDDLVLTGLTPEKSSSDQSRRDMSRRSSSTIGSPPSSSLTGGTTRRIQLRG
jgi:hypothetical protein